MSKNESPKQNSTTSLHRLVFVLQQLSDELLEQEAGVGLAQARVLSQLGTTPRSQRVVAAKLGQSEANVSRQVQLLKKRGLASVVRNKKDHRQRDVTLTAKGSRLAKKTEGLLSAQHKELLRLLNASEAKAFNSAVSHLLSSLNVESRRSQKIFGKE